MGPGESPAQTLSLWLEEIGSSLIISFFHSWFTHQGGEQSLGIICREFLSELLLTILSYILRNLKQNQSAEGRKSDTAFQNQMEANVRIVMPLLSCCLYIC